ncbi:MAG TPA: HAMP domain-containing sensor histidine kinase, partial [Labilithrix sp.]|nr:HAMP domain-containing sensor histidine kinase [Labilithrix sp.]
PVQPGLDLARGEGVRLEPTAGGVRRVSVWLPVDENGISPGALELSRPLDQEAQLVRWVVRDKALTSMGAVLVAVFLSVVVGLGFIGKPINALVLQARRIGAGDTSSRVAVVRRDEIGDLGHELNAMCEQLNAAREKLLAEADARVKTVEQLRHADRLSTVGKLAAGLAHELGTPLNVVSGRAKMIASGRLASDAVVENATIIHGQAARMTKIIRQLLDFARRGHAKKATVDVKALSRSVVELLTPLARKRGVVLSLDGGEGAAMLDVDAGQIEQVLSNLVVNGVDAISEGGEVVVRIRAEAATPPAGSEAEPGDYLRIDVQDSGAGIRKEDVGRVFEPFFTTKDVGLGTGLGLSVAHGIVREHGGWIAVQSEEKRGSCFSVYLPRPGETA